MFCYAIMWASVYLMQKSSYNNHYYLLMLLCGIMFFLPAHKNVSIDAWRNPSLREISMPRWIWLFIVIQLWIIYTYASVAKLYPDWFTGAFPEILMKSKADYWLVGDLLQQKWTHFTISWFGFLFDLIIIPCLLIKRTRVAIFIAAIFFHLFNSFIFHIGIFPYLSLAFILFFFPVKDINKWFLRGKKKFYDKKEVIIPKGRNILVAVLAVWFIIQLGLPLRHWFYEDDVLWTEEGHRLSWRMMLRSKSGRTTFKVVDKNTQEAEFIDKTKYLSRKQLGAINSKPDMIWQFAQRLKREYAKQGKDVQVFVDSKVSVNGRPYQAFIDPTVDLANEKWQHFKHHDWILPSKLD